MENRKKNDLLFCDLSAGAVCTALYGWLFFRLSRISLFLDEATSLLYVERFMQGYRPFIDDWGAEQLTAPFLYLPYHFWLLISGSTDGVVLFMRYCYLAVSIVLFWYLYSKLRHRGFYGLIAVAVFSAYIPASICTLNYYTMHVQGLAVFCAIIFLSNKEPTPAKKALAGFVFACTVMLEPTLAFIYLLYSLLVLLRTILHLVKKDAFQSYAFLLDKKTWGFLTVGCAAAFALFLLWIQCTGGIMETIKAFPVFLKNWGFGVSTEGNYLQTTFEAIGTIYGLYMLALAGGFAVAAALNRYIFKKPLVAKIIFLASLLYFCFMLVYIAIIFVPAIGDPDAKPYWPYYFTVTPTVVLLCLGLIWHILLKNKNQKLFCVWCLGAAASLAVDAVSEVTSCVSFAVGMFSTVLLLPEVVAELKAASEAGKKLPAIKKQKNKKHNIEELRQRRKNEAFLNIEKKFRLPLTISVAAAFVSICAVSAFNVYLEGYFKTYGHSAEYNERIEAGVFKGLYVSAEKKSAYEKVRAGVRLVPEDPNVQLHVVSNCPELYLDAGCGISVCDPWFYCEDSFDRQVEWWKQHPERLPDYIYIPRYYYASGEDEDSDKDFLDACFALYDKAFDYEKTETAGGILLKVTSEHIPA